MDRSGIANYLERSTSGSAAKYPDGMIQADTSLGRDGNYGHGELMPVIPCAIFLQSCPFHSFSDLPLFRIPIILVNMFSIVSSSCKKSKTFDEVLELLDLF